MAKKNRGAKAAPAESSSNQEGSPVHISAVKKRKLSSDPSDAEDQKRSPSENIKFASNEGVPGSREPTLESTETPSVPFVYEPLRRDIDSIRLLTLLPSSTTSSVIHCTLSATTFGSKPLYTALSYTWGPPATTHSIVINSHTVPLRENLYWALFYLRQSSPRSLWIDALCIDQSSNEDKEYQIRLMDYIYNRAETVVVWLGKYPDTKLSWTLNKDIPKKQSPYAVRSEGEWSEWMEWFRILRAWVCDNPYWRRLWIIQEIGLARKLVVHISHQSIEWEDFIVELELQASAPGFDSKHPGPLLIQKLHHKRQNRHGNWNRLETLLEDFQDAECAEVRDKIYGLLGLASDCLAESIEVDYLKSRFELYAEVIEFFNGKQHSRDEGWSAVDRSMRVVRFSQLVCKILLSPSVPESPPSHANPILIQTRGAVVGHIRHLGPTYTEMMSSSTANKKFKISIHDYYPGAYEGTRLREAYEAYYDRLLKMTDEETGKFCGLQPRERYSRGFLTDVVWSGDDRVFNQKKIDIPEWHWPDGLIIQNPSREVSDRRIFLGNRETMGLAPAEAQVGDLICLFWKTDVAALLRKEEDRDLYRIVGRLNISTPRVKGSRYLYVEWKEPHKDAKIVMIQMSILTLNELTR